MKAEDTVMKPKEISKTVGLFYSGGSSGLERVAIKQAETSFKAGIKEVVDWIKEIAIMGYKEGELGVKPPTDLVLDLYLWNKKLKEWGIKEEQ